MGLFAFHVVLMLLGIWTIDETLTCTTTPDQMYSSLLLPVMNKIVRQAGLPRFGGKTS